jgi:DNA-binding MarR family transcriptional regulator
MDKPTENTNQPVNMATITTWQSGIAQSHAFRTTKKLTDDFLKSYNLSTMHWFIVGAIFDTGAKGIRITDLAAQLGTTVGYLTTAINSLELKGMVTRDEHESDSRTKILKIHPDFYKTCTTIEEGLRDRFRTALYQNLTRDELQTYISVLYKLTKINPGVSSDED